MRIGRKKVDSPPISCNVSCEEVHCEGEVLPSCIVIFRLKGNEVTQVACGLEELVVSSVRFGICSDESSNRCTSKGLFCILFPGIVEVGNDTITCSCRFGLCWIATNGNFNSIVHSVTVRVGDMWAGSSLIGVHKIKERIFDTIEKAIIIGVRVDGTRSGLTRTHKSPATIFNLVAESIRVGVPFSRICL